MNKIHNVLAELVACKALQDAADAIHDGPATAEQWSDKLRMVAEYERREPLAWVAARAALAQEPAEFDDVVKVLTATPERHLTRDEQTMLSNALRKSARQVYPPSPELMALAQEPAEIDAIPPPMAAHGSGTAVAKSAAPADDLVRDLHAAATYYRGTNSEALYQRAIDAIEALQAERVDWARRFKLNDVTPWDWMTRAEAAEQDAKQAHKELDALQRDITEATSHIVLQPVEPGTDLSRVLAANAELSRRAAKAEGK